MNPAKLIPFPASPGQQDLRHGKLAHELEFLPAALEVIETPASPAGRAIGYVIVAFFLIALAWACLGHVDIIATARGKIIPTGRTKVIQPFEIGTVRAIHVQEGQAVREGELLVELDPTANTAEVDRLTADQTAAALDIARLRAALSDTPDPLAAFAPPPEASPMLIALHRQLLLNQLAEQRAKLAVLDRQQAQHEGDRAAVAATVDKLTAAIPLLRERAETKRYLATQGTGSKMNALELEQQLIEYGHELTVQRNRLIESEAQLAGIAETRAQTRAEFRRNLLSDLSTAEQKAASVTQELVKAVKKTDLQRLTAPVDGTVQQLDIHTIGGVVTPAQQLMMIVPRDSKLEIEAMILNKDVGFVQEGNEAEIKIDTFNFTKYGLLHGTVLHVSHDAVTPDKTGGTSQAQQQDSRPPTQQQPPETVYAARIALEQTAMMIDGKEVALTPGMAVTAEIKTGRRRVIEYVLSPVMRYRQESARER